jgi:hypothetical protein
VSPFSARLNVSAMCARTACFLRTASLTPNRQCTGFAQVPSAGGPNLGGIAHARIPISQRSRVRISTCGC